jgi:hypothetical protein
MKFAKRLTISICRDKFQQMRENSASYSFAYLPSRRIARIVIRQVQERR